MAGRPQTATKDSAAPGPGAYNTTLLREKAGVRFGKDSRKGLSESYSHFVPGPGAYESATASEKKHAAPKYTYISDNRIVDLDQNRVEVKLKLLLQVQAHIIQKLLLELKE